MAPRRFGKTALLQAVQSRLADRSLAAYVNCLAVTGSPTFHDRVVEELLAVCEERFGRARLLLATWRDVLKRPVLGMLERLDEIGGSIKYVGEIRLKFRTREVDERKLLESTFDFLEEFAQEQGESVVLILDEFQALASFGELIFPLFKEKMDEQQRVTYIFSGSSLSLLSEVFGREGKSPLYQMVGRIFLQEIEPSIMKDFVRRRLEEVHGVDITDEALALVSNLVGGIPYYVQKLGLELERQLLFAGEKTIEVSDVEAAFTNLLNELETDFQERWTTRFSEQQRAILHALSGGPATSSEIAERIGTDAENLTYNLRRLQGAMILTKEDSRYRITDRVFAAWLNRL
ncbi:MAG: ATP-binding protein, partial [Candidatus Bipolaricaulia bacterium]